jgi:tetratricopeptide (TPR) repeat protein
MELLEDDPQADLYLQVGEELVRRTRWKEARDVVTQGLKGDERPVEAYLWLARATLELGDYDACLKALAEADTAPGTEAGRIEVLALERSGQTDAARDKALAYLEADPDDVVVSSVVERLEAPPPAAEQRGLDPMLTVERAERYVKVGRIDRAVRVYRRILRSHPDDQGLQIRIRELMAAADDDLPDDLSEELDDPSLVPPEFDMPAPGMGPGTGGGRADPVTEETATPPKPKGKLKRGGRRRRRSLINP